MSSITAGTTSTTTLIHSGDTTGSLVFKTNDTGSGGTTAVTLDTNQNATFAGKVTSAGALTLASNGTTTAVTIDTSQRTGFGTTSPNEKLVVNGAIRSTNNAVSATATADSGLFYFVPTADAPSDPRTMVQGVGTASVGASIAFLTGTSSSNTERMRIDSSGKVNINTTGNTDAFLVVNGGSGNHPIRTLRDGTANSTQMSFANANGTVGSITTNGSATAYNTSSDYRLKENIAPMTGALAKVAQLKPVTYKWKVDGSDGEGFIAHELAEVKPDCVSGDKDAVDADGKPVYQGIDTSFLVATLTAALQETKALIDTQAETINALTARIVALERQ